MEAGGHRGAFDATKAEARMVGLFSLLPAVVDAVKVPVVAAGGIADGRGVGAALLLGASAVQVGTAFLRCPEARVPTAWADAIGRTAPEETMVTRVFSGRPGRSIATAYVRAATAATAPPPVPYPVQRGLTQAMRDAAVKGNDIERIQAWAGQSAGMARTDPAAECSTVMGRGKSVAGGHIAFLFARVRRLRHRLLLCGSPDDPPPLKWSDLRYVFDIKEDCNGKEAIQA